MRTRQKSVNIPDSRNSYVTYSTKCAEFWFQVNFPHKAWRRHSVARFLSIRKLFSNRNINCYYIFCKINFWPMHCWGRRILTTGFTVKATTFNHKRAPIIYQSTRKDTKNESRNWSWFFKAQLSLALLLILELATWNLTIGETAHWFNCRLIRVNACLSVKRIISPVIYNVMQSTLINPSRFSDR